MTKEQPCDECKGRPAEWALQYIAGDVPSFYLLGWHIRGFPLRRVCDVCKGRIEAKRNPLLIRKE